MAREAERNLHNIWYMRESNGVLIHHLEERWMCGVFSARGVSLALASTAKSVEPTAATWGDSNNGSHKID